MRFAIAFILVTLMAAPAFSAETEEVLNLKKSLAVEKISRLTLEIQLMQKQFQEDQTEIAALKNSVSEYDKQLKEFKKPAEKK